MDEMLGMDRRSLIKRGAVATGAVWAAPAITQLGAVGAVGSPPPIGCGRMTFGGFLDTTQYGRVTYGGELHCGDPAVPPNRLEVNWPGGNNFHLTGTFTATCTDTTANELPPDADFDTLTGTGTGRFNNVEGYTATIILTDSGEPGTSDTIDLTITDGSGATVLAMSGVVSGGNVQAHRATGSKSC